MLTGALLQANRAEFGCKDEGLAGRRGERGGSDIEKIIALRILVQKL